MFHRSLVVAFTVLLLTSATFAAPAAKPNIILIVADDLGYADIGAQGLSKDVKTPNIDSIATNGTRFTAGYVSCPVCSPTRAGLLTGRYQQRFGHELNEGDGDTPFGLPTDQVTIAQSLKSAGYVTGIVGKWHLGNRPEMHPTKRGFDEFFGFLGGAHGYNRVETGPNALQRGTEPLASTDYLTDAFGREAVAFVEKHTKSPFFLYLPFNAVHTPQEAPQKYTDRFAGVADPKRKLMLAMLSAMDDQVGLLLAKLRDLKLDQNTLIFFVGDNGGPTGPNSSLNTPFSGFKGDVLEGGVRVPMLLQWPAALPKGRVIDDPAIQIDFFPTMLAAAGAEAPANVKLDGVNLLPCLKGEAKSQPHDYLYWRYGRQWAIRDGQYKLVNLPRLTGNRPALYDLNSDPAEAKNLADTKPEEVKRLRAAYDEWNTSNIPPLWQGRQPTTAPTGARRPARRGA